MRCQGYYKFSWKTKLKTKITVDKPNHKTKDNSYSVKRIQDFFLKHSRHKTGLPWTGLNGTVVSFPHSAQTTATSLRRFLEAPSGIAFLKHSLHLTGRPSTGSNGISHSFPHSEQTALKVPPITNPYKKDYKNLTIQKSINQSSHNIPGDGTRNISKKNRSRVKNIKKLLLHYS